MPRHVPVPSGPDSPSEKSDDGDDGDDNEMGNDAHSCFVDHERWNVITHAVASVVVVLYVAVRSAWRPTGIDDTLQLFPFLWTAHLVATSISGGLFIASTAFHVFPIGWWILYRALRSLDVAFIVLASGPAITAGTLVYLGAFWRRLPKDGPDTLGRETQLSEWVHAC